MKPANFLPLICALVWSLCLTSAWAATISREEKHGDDQWLVLENDHARVAVFPDAGAAIVEYVDKRTGTNFVAGTAKRGAAVYAWKEVTRVRPTDPSTDWFGAKPYTAKFANGRGGSSIVATCDAGGLRVEREMRLADNSAELTVLIRHTNTSKEPRGVWLRWHPYMVLDDPFAESSFIALPGPGTNQVRKIAVGMGFDTNQMDVPGYWLAMNHKSGVGMWMTFRKDQIVDCATWTDASESQHPKRGWFTAELFPKPVLLQPAESTELDCTYYPFNAQDTAEKIPFGFVAESDRAAAKRFLRLVRSNGPVVGGHTMVPAPNNEVTSIKDNCFYFTQRRRDRFALLDWGIADAMLAVSAVQTNAVRLRLFARLFESHQQPVKLRYELRVENNVGKSVAHPKWDYTLTPTQSRVFDKREEFPIKDLADGWHTFTLEAFAGDGQEPVHRYVERRKLTGQRRGPIGEARRATDAKPLADRERPFVTALRRVEIPKGDAVQVPIGVEEVGGNARKTWPARVGVPFAKGRVTKQTSIRVTSPDGKDVATQTKIMGTWPDGSTKWLLVDFPADAPASGHAFYNLTTGTGNAAVNTKSILTADGNRIVVDTGVSRRELSIGREGKILGLFNPADLWWETGAGQRYEFKLKGDGAGMIVEANGPLRAVVKATGWYYDTRNGAAPPIAMGELRAEFYGGQKFYRLYHTVTYAGQPWHDTLGGYGIRFGYSDKVAKRVSIELDGKVVSRNDRLNLQQVDEDLAVVTDATDGVTNGRRASGAASLTTDKGDVVVYHRDLWKLHPKKIEADAATGSLTFHYWPKEAGAMDWRPREDGWIPSSSSIETLAVGASRTHEFIIDEEANPPLTEYVKLFDEPVLAVVPPRYLCATEALLHLQPYDPEKMPELEQLISETFDSYLLNQELHGWYGEWIYGSIPNLCHELENRWADYGRYAHILNEQDICHTPWLAYLRSGDRKYFKFAEANTRQLLEVATIRLDPVWPQLAGLSHRHHECIWLGGGDHGHSMLDPFLELYHVTGYQPAWEASERMARAMAEQHTQTWRYLSNPIAGLSRMFLETQEPFYKEQADRIWRELCAPDRNDWWNGDHANRMVLYYSQLNPECDAIWKDKSAPKTERFEGLDVLAAVYRQTGDIKYAQAALTYFRGYQQDADHYVPTRTEPLRWSIGELTQAILAHVREMCYASQALADAQASESKPKP